MKKSFEFLNVSKQYGPAFDNTEAFTNLGLMDQQVPKWDENRSPKDYDLYQTSWFHTMLDYEGKLWDYCRTTGSQLYGSQMKSILMFRIMHFHSLTISRRVAFH